MFLKCAEIPAENKRNFPLSPFIICHNVRIMFLLFHYISSF